MSEKKARSRGLLNKFKAQKGSWCEQRIARQEESQWGCMQGGVLGLASTGLLRTILTTEHRGWVSLTPSPL